MSAFAFGNETSAEGVAWEGQFQPGVLRAFLHLGESYNRADLAKSAGGITFDYLANYGGETGQRPYPGLAYGNLETHNDFPSQTLVWTVVASDNDTWTTDGSGLSRDNYDKYMCIYLQNPGTTDLPIQYKTNHDDGLRVWNNGESIHVADAYKVPDDFDGVLHPGENCILFKFQEDSGGDQLTISIVARNGADLSQVTYSFYPKALTVVNPKTGSERFISDKTVNFTACPYVDGKTQYQITTSDDAASLADGGWAAYTPDLTCDYTIPDVLAEGDSVTPCLWLRAGEGDASPVCVKAATMTYTLTPPTAVTCDVGLDIDTENGTAIDASVIDNGSSDAISGIASMWVEPAKIYAAGQVTLHVMNNAGLESTAVANISIVKREAIYVDVSGDDKAGDGTDSKPFQTLSKALSFLSGNLHEIRIKAGIYKAAQLGTLPVSVPSGAKLVAVGGGGVVFDAENNSENVVRLSGVSDVTLEGITFAHSTGPAVKVTDGSTGVTLKDCSFVQTQESSSMANALTLDAANGACSVTLEDCTFQNLIGRKFVISLDGKDSTLTAKNCLFANNSVKSFNPNARTNSDYGNRCGTVFASDGNTFVFEDCTFSENTTDPVDAVPPHDCCNSSAFYIGGGSVRIDRCTFVGNTGSGLFGFCSNQPVIANSLFADNNVYRAMQCGYNVSMYWRNCTLVRNSGGYAGYRANRIEFDNCLFYKDGPASRGVNCPSWSDPDGNPSAIYFLNSVRHESDVGKGYNEGGSTLLDVELMLENPDVAWDAEGFDVRPKATSGLIDASDQSLVYGELDILGHVRSADNNQDGTAVADIGCYESLFYAAVEPTFEIPYPGTLSAVRGATCEVPVSIKPAPAADATVTAQITYGTGLTGPGTLTFAPGVTEMELAVKVDLDCPDQTSFDIADAGTTGVIGTHVECFTADLVMSVGGQTDFLVKGGTDLEIPVTFSLKGGTVPSDVPFTVGTVDGAGSNVIAWEGETVVKAGAYASTGVLKVKGGLGLNTVTITLTDGGTFVETDSNSVTLKFTGYDGYLVVKPGAGTDVVGYGYAADVPLNSIDFALKQATAGDEIRILPGTYETDTITFPIKSLGVTVKGWDPSGAAAGVILDGGNAVESLFKIQGATPSAIAGLTLRNTTGALIQADGCVLSVADCAFTQSGVNYDASGAIQLDNAAQVTATDSTFSGITRRAVVYCRNIGNKSTFTARGCSFTNNHPAFATLSGDLTREASNEGNGNCGAVFDLEDCDFVGNEIPTFIDGRPLYLADLFRSPVMVIRQEGKVTINRCRFLANKGGNLIGFSGGSTMNVANSLFAGNVASDAMFHGYNSKIWLQNCTMVGNSGGYAAMMLETTFTDSIIVNDGTLHWGSTGTKTDGSALGIWGGAFVKLVNTILHGTTVDPAHSYDGGSSVIEQDPKLRSIAGDVTAKSFKPIPQLGSPAIDAARSYDAGTWGDKDVSGAARALPGLSKSGDPLVDLGAFEFDRKSLGFTVIVK